MIRTIKRITTVASGFALFAFTALPGLASNDPYFDRQWALTKISAPQAWNTSTGSGVTIAIIDTGVDISHEDLAANMVQGTSVFKCPKKGACNTSGRDDHGHGTHVAGIAAAVANNGKGIAGVAPSAKLMPVKVLDKEGSGSVGDIAAGIRYAADRGAKVLNMSLGELSGVGQAANVLGWNQPITEAINYAWSKGAVTIVAAGNDGFPLCAPPSDHGKAICVGATDSLDLSSYYSNRGDVDLVAPGGEGSVFCEDWRRDILSTIWAGSEYDCQGTPTNGGTPFINGYETMAGTSMAAPHVSGVAALIIAAHPTWTPQQVVDKLRASVDDLGAPGYDVVFGAGRINAAKAVS